ncbi:MAG: LysE family transporter [Candidatus Symbiothrix sp.]|jgi:threonine/homoserine/homoserine lactone efflux protein|nr:LysE family transporter [Candidatus Symbiothrix sp.]
MIQVIYKGIIIGVLVSAPMGPIGLLCLQRTLYKGRWHGFFSGVGAAFSDLLYAVITCMGMGIVVVFIEDNQSILQFAGSILLFIFGVYIYRTNPSEKFKKPKDSSRKRSYSQDALTAFILTVSNPLIIFLYIALFARFGFIEPDTPTANKIQSVALGLFSIFAGALLWWFTLTMSVGTLLSGVFQERGLKIINRVLGTAIMVLSVFGLAYSMWEIWK